MSAENVGEFPLGSLRADSKGDVWVFTAIGWVCTADDVSPLAPRPFEEIPQPASDTAPDDLMEVANLVNKAICEAVDTDNLTCGPTVTLRLLQAGYLRWRNFEETAAALRARRRADLYQEQLEMVRAGMSNPPPVSLCPDCGHSSADHGPAYQGGNLRQCSVCAPGGCVWPIKDER